MIGGLPITPLPPRPQGDDLRPQVEWLENRIGHLERGLYGDPRNDVPGIPERLRAIEKRLDQMARQTLYWRIGQGVMLGIIIVLLMGVLQ